MSFKKMALVPEIELQRLRQKEIREYDPQLRTLALIQSEIDSIMNNDKLTPDEKMNFFANAQSRFQGLHQKYLNKTDNTQQSLPTRTSVPPPPAAAPAQAEAAEPVATSNKDEKDDLSGILDSVIPTKSRKRAQAILDEMKKHPDILSFDDSFRLTKDGIPLGGTNIIDLIADLYTTRKDSSPEGRSSFLQGLRDLHIPTSSITNPKLRRAYTNLDNPALEFESKSSIPLSKHKHKPPGKQAKVLQLYK